MAGAYLSPGVYVEEIPSALQAIAGVSTSTAVFIGLSPDSVEIPKPNPKYDPTKVPTAESAAAAAASAAASTSSRRSRSSPSGEGSTEPGEGSGTSDTQPSTVSPAAAEATNSPYVTETFALLAPAGEPRLITNFGEFRRLFGDFSTDEGHNRLVHAVFAFFNNSGSRCYVVRLTTTAQLNDALTKLEAIDEIAIVAAPGMTEPSVRASLVAHCDESKHLYRFAILDTPEVVDPIDSSMSPPASKNAALYFPWVKVFDPGKKIRDPKGDGSVFMPPSGFMAGIYARVDTQRGVHKAAANEPVLGAIGLRYAISKAQQDGLNPLGINCIRYLNGAYRVWGARTVGGSRNMEWRFVPVRRTYFYLGKSLEEGTQWVVFEPNDQNLWAKIVRNARDFLSGMRQSGYLFGATDAEAFYVKCDAETNPTASRELGLVVTEIGIAIVRPAEFVIFRISQWSATAPA
jgi:Bacteriophage tail sheath protein